jgi:membrane-associated protease RseP (regulator of RpoE activity)
MRVAVGTVILICGLVPPGLAQPSGPTARHAQVSHAQFSHAQVLHAQLAAACGWIGVQVSPMTRAFADSLGMAEPYGAIFDQPEAGSPAAAGGIQAGDVITAINGSPVMRSGDFAAMIAALAPNTTAYLSTSRDGQAIEVMLMTGSGKCPSAQHGGVLIPAGQTPAG